MKVTFPYMGTTLVYSKLAEMLGHEVIAPPKPTQRTFDLGVKYSPEFACFPLKVLLGNYIEAIEKGAKVIVTSGGFGPCRVGFYGEMHKRILQNLEYDVDVIVFDSFTKDPINYIKNLIRFKGKTSLWRLIKIFRLLYRLAKDLDDLEKRIQVKRAYEIYKGDCTKVWNRILNLYKGCSTKKDLERLKRQCNELIDTISIKEINENERIRIAIVGEIYVVMESSVNMNIEEVLGELGCEIHRSHYLSQWIDDNMLPSWISNSEEEEILKKGGNYLEVWIGGHGKETIGHIVDYAHKGFNGVIQLMPFGCLPELVSQSIIPKIVKDLKIPVLTISIDEQMGIANNLTRIEAFVDLIRGKKNRSREAAS